METKTIHARMALIKAELAKTEIKKSGYNRFAGFKYHELGDFIQVINALNEKYGVNDFVTIDKENGAALTLSCVDNESSYTVHVPFEAAEMLAKGGAASNVDAIQRLGSTITYLRRYLYMTAYNIQENDAVDAVEQPTKAAKPAKKVDLGVILSKVSGSTTETILKGIWEANPNLHTDETFKNAVSNRKIELQKQQK